MSPSHWAQDDANSIEPETTPSPDQLYTKRTRITIATTETTKRHSPNYRNTSNVSMLIVTCLTMQCRDRKRDVKRRWNWCGEMTCSSRSNTLTVTLGSGISCASVFLQHICKQQLSDGRLDSHAFIVHPSLPSFVKEIRAAERGSDIDSDLGQLQPSVAIPAPQKGAEVGWSIFVVSEQQA